MDTYPSFTEFDRLAKEANFIPVSCEILADLETPVSAYLKVVGTKPGFLLESAEGGERFGRYSFLGTDPSAIIRTKGNRIEIETGTAKEVKEESPFPFLRKYLSGFKVAADPTLPRFSGGLVGYFSYDVVRFFENLPDIKEDDQKLPDIQLFLADTILAFDHFRHRLKIITHARPEEGSKKAYEGAKKRIAEIISRLSSYSLPLDGGGEVGVKCRGGVASPPKRSATLSGSLMGKSQFQSNFSRPEFETAVLKAKEYIRKGDAIQVVLSQRLCVDYPESGPDPFDLYRAIRAINPSPYLYYFNFDKTILVGSSPEVMVRLEEGKATLRPIAGTRPRGQSEPEDRELEDDLKKDEKEKAEHIMLVDLGRNDLGRVCQPGTVTVTELMAVEKYSHVMHLVSNITGDLRPDKDAFDLFSAAFPAGTVSGAPKIRAMEIIEELEPVKRGPYAGAVGYFDFSGNLDTCITIRTVWIEDGKAYLQVGAGIVADSVPSREYEETLNKGQAFLEALRLASSGLL
ncbi:MAG: anthranilate synthase component I [Candidatus Omnitrophota bacterium]|nr:anthranilate synthase component I [Candidatus Omnitrophota bacterium]